MLNKGIYMTKIKARAENEDFFWEIKDMFVVNLVIE